MNPELGNGAEKEPLKINVFSDFETALQAVFDIESSWLSRDLDPREKEGIRSQIAAAADVAREMLDLAQSEVERQKMLKRNLKGFQGIDGGNRYGILGDGSIVLSGSHTNEPSREKAEQLGIEVPRFI
jgi:hypothetical protein